jgi:2-C-methyl-D-erythritol 4-phosphate cytidylyltransferase
MDQDTSRKTGAIIVAAGVSRRMDGVDKLYALIDGQPLIIRATRPFQDCPRVHRVVVVVSGEKEKLCRSLVTGEEWSKVSDVCLGGERRQDSVVAGLKQLTDCHWIIIHDGARPLVTVDLIENGLAAAEETGAAAAAVPVTDTIKLAEDDQTVRETLPRQNLWAVQTPQVFRADIIAQAYSRARNDVTDDASIVEQAGGRVKLYMGSYANIKVTTPDDLALAEILWQRYER